MLNISPMTIFGGGEELHFGLGLDSPFNFTCQRCGSCCYHRRIGLNEYEVEQLALHLGVEREEFISRFLNFDTQPEIKTREDGSCIFLDNRRCGVHPARPLVCRLYPLGLLFGRNNESRWGIMPVHPDCLGLITLEGTVEAYLKSQGARPYLNFELSRRLSST